MSTDTFADARRTDTRDRIIRVAAGLFADRGFAGTSIRDISDALGVTKAALYYHFASKDDILRAIVDQPITSVRSVMDKQPPLASESDRRAFVRDIIASMAECDPESIAVFKDPQIQALVSAEISASGITNVLAITLASALSGTTDPAQIQPEHLVRATAAVAAGLAVIDSWHLAFPDEPKFSPTSIDYIADTVSAVLER
ncbi:TetR/AcrR family transcriptional regulator [Demequina sp.]|uniref:TetR/AcrR family transcriptional regulator n=1 Tax=Demequina sp. TaxID=2050685 RepID=UPI003D0C9356